MADDVSDHEGVDQKYFDDSDSDGCGTESISDETQDVMHVPTSVVVNGVSQTYSKEGELFKQGGIKRNQGWNKRYIRFDGKTLRYYKNRNTPVSLRIIPVAIMVNVQPVKSARAYQFELECVNRTFQFGTDDINNAQQWQSYLMSAIIDHKKNGQKLQDGGEMSNPDMCGSIRFDRNGKKYFVAIKGDIFRYYYNEQDYKLDSPIHELSLKLSSVTIIEPTKLMLRSAPDQKFLLNFESADEATQWEMAITEAIEENLGDNEIFNKVKELRANQICADCSSSRASWASINLAIVLCAKCAGVHRRLGVTVSKVRSLRMDDVFKKNKNLLQLFNVIGNAAANAFWAKSPPSDGNTNARMSILDREIHIKRKYLDRAYADVQRKDVHELNTMLHAAVRVNDVHSAMACLFSGAEISYRNEDGKTAMDIAEDLGHGVMKIEGRLVFGPNVASIINNEFLVQNESIVMHAVFEDSDKNDKVVAMPKKTGIYLDGYLEKTGPNMKGYLKRWIVLHYGILSYYEEKGGKKPPKQTINVLDDIISVSTSLTTDRQHAFELSCKAGRGRVYRFAAPDCESRACWLAALVKVVSPDEILSEQLEDCSQLDYTGRFYIKLDQGSWRRAWITLRGDRIDIWTMEDMRRQLSVCITRDTKLYKYNAGRSSKLMTTLEDVKLLDGNQSIEIVTDKQLTKFQGLLLKDTDKLYALVDRMLKRMETC